MCVRLFSLTVLVVSLALESHAADYTKLLYRDCGSKGGVIENIDLTPMPVFNPGEAYLTLVAQLNRPVSTYPIELDIRDRHSFLVRRNYGDQFEYHSYRQRNHPANQMLSRRWQACRFVHVR